MRNLADKPHQRPASFDESDEAVESKDDDIVRTAAKAVDMP
jgi:hypothetical protein